MREQEMRMRVFRFLKTRMRNMIMPATVGLGLAVGGACVENHGTPTYNDAAATKQDVGGIPIYSAPIYNDAATVKQDAVLASDAIQSTVDLAPDSVPDLLGLDGEAAPDADNRDVLTSEAGSKDATPGGDRAPDLGGMKYLAPFFDAPPADASVDFGSSAKYVAQMPDAAGGDTPATRYLAQMPDAAVDRSVNVLYMAQLPFGT